MHNILVKVLTQDLSLIEEEINAAFPKSLDSTAAQDKIENFGCCNNTPIVNNYAAIRAMDWVADAVKQLVESEYSFQTVEIIQVHGQVWDGAKWVDAPPVTWQEEVKDANDNPVMQSIYDGEGNVIGEEPLVVTREAPRIV